MEEKIFTAVAVGEQTGDSVDEDSNREYWTITDQDGREIKIALDDDGTLDVAIGEYGNGAAYVIWVTDAVTSEEIAVGAYFDREEAENAVTEIEKFGVSRNDKGFPAIELLKAAGEFNPKTASEFRGLSALEFLNDEY